MVRMRFGHEKGELAEDIDTDFKDVRVLKQFLPKNSENTHQHISIVDIP